MTLTQSPHRCEGGQSPTPDRRSVEDDPCWSEVVTVDLRVSGDSNRGWPRFPWVVKSNVECHLSITGELKEV